MLANQEDRFLLLIRHSAVRIDKNLPAKEWSLSTTGRERCRQFAPQLASYYPSAFLTSKEIKAIETGKLLAEMLGVPVDTALDLHEHDRMGMPFFADQTEFRNAVGRFFANPEKRVFGRETAAEASERFDSAVTQLLNQHQHSNLAVVTHGTVMTLFVCRYNPTCDPITFWNSLQMPCAALLRLPDMAFRELILPSGL